MLFHPGDPVHTESTPPKNRAHAQPTRHAHYPFPRTTVSELTPVNSVLQTRLPRPRSRIHISPHSHRPSTELECQTPYLAPIKVPAAVVQLFTSPRFIQDISPHLYTLGANTRETVCAPSRDPPPLAPVDVMTHLLDTADIHSTRPIFHANGTMR